MGRSVGCNITIANDKWYFLDPTEGSMYGIVEFADGVKEVSPSDIKFRDHTNYELQACQKKLEELKKEEK